MNNINVFPADRFQFPADRLHWFSGSRNTRPLYPLKHKDAMKIKKRINAIHDDHIETLLINLGLLNKIESGEEKCKFCSKVVSVDSITAIFPESGSIKFICEKIICMKSLSQYLQEHEFSNEE